jgi:hypothetical protein
MPEMFSPYFELENSKDHPFNHLPLKSNPYMTPDTAVCREEWARLLANIKSKRVAAEGEEGIKLLYLEMWAEKELTVVNAYCDWVDISLNFSDAEYLGAILSVKAFNRFRRLAHWKSLVP